MHGKWLLDSTENGVEMAYVNLHTGHLTLCGSFLTSDFDLVPDVLVNESSGVGELIVSNGVVTGFIMAPVHDEQPATCIPLNLETAFLLEA